MIPYPPVWKLLNAAFYYRLALQAAHDKELALAKLPSKNHQHQAELDEINRSIVALDAFVEKVDAFEHLVKMARMRLLLLTADASFR